MPLTCFHVGVARFSPRTAPRTDNITVEGIGPDKPLLFAHVKSFADFALRTLLPKATYARVNVHIRAGSTADEVHSSDDAVTGPVDWNKAYPSSFVIDLFDQSMAMMNDFELLLIVSHELVHVKQFALGHLRGRSDRIFWKWMSRECREPNYWLQPWEVEAHGLERILLHYYALMAEIPSPFDRFLNLRTTSDASVDLHNSDRL